MKSCQSCKLQKEESDFVKNTKICRVCNNTKIKNFYKNNSSYRQSVKIRSALATQLHRKIINEFKSFYGCYFCAEIDPICLQFHHLNPTEKDFEIHGGTKSSLNRYKQEIDKCEILCANCHLKVHANTLVVGNRRNIDSTTLIIPKLVSENMVQTVGLEPT